MGFLNIKVISGKSQNEIVEWLDENVLKVKIAAMPKKGQANEEIIRFFAKKIFCVHQSEIAIVKGHTSRKKTLKIENIETNDIEKLVSDFCR